MTRRIISPDVDAEVQMRHEFSQDARRRVCPGRRSVVAVSLRSGKMLPGRRRFGGAGRGAVGGFQPSASEQVAAEGGAFTKNLPVRTSREVFAEGDVAAAAQGTFFACRGEAFMPTRAVGIWGPSKRCGSSRRRVPSPEATSPSGSVYGDRQVRLLKCDSRAVFSHELLMPRRRRPCVRRRCRRTASVMMHCRVAVHARMSHEGQGAALVLTSTTEVVEADALSSEPFSGSPR